MIEEGILDTNTVILLPRLSASQELPTYPLITTITLAELAAGPLLAVDDDERAARLQHLSYAESEFEALPFDSAAARAFGKVSSDLRRAGRKRSARAFDAQIAAIAISRSLPLFSANARDFRGIEGLDVIEVDHPDRRN